MEDNIIIPNAGIDDIPHDVFTADELEEGGSTTSETVIRYNNTPVLDQSLQPETRMACGSYAISKGINEANFLEGSYPQNNCDPQKFRSRICEKYDGSIAGGSSMTGNLKNAMASGLISGYYKCKTVWDVVAALKQGRLVYTGSAKFDHEKMRADKYGGAHFVEKSGGHLVAINGFDEEKEIFYIANSYGKDLYVDGHNTLKFSDFDKMYSMIALIDTKDSHIVVKVKSDRELLTKAKTIGIWNGQRGDNQIVAGELDIMLGRLKFMTPTGTPYDRLLTRKQAADIITQTTKTTKKIWNENNGDQLCTRSMAVLMLMRL